MQPDELGAFRETFAADWAADLSRVEDIPMEAALEEAVKRIGADLDGALDSAEHRLFVIAAGGEAVGTLWFSVREGRAFLDDITIAEKHRGNGYGRRALELMHAELRQLGARLVQLNVYAHNPGARALYERLGYEVTGVKMTKHLKE
jgi:ribosomal protein S18 acetylase RimI-like enzyme